MAATVTPNAAESPPALLRLAPEWRRVGVYLLVGYAAIVGTSVWVKTLDAYKGSWNYLVIVSCVLAVPCIGGAVLLFRQVLRIDQQGIWRRRMFRWDMWPWAAFASGAIRQADLQVSFVFSAKPWWYRYLHLTYLAPADREAVAGRIHQIWRPPPLNLPDRMSIEYGIGHRLTVSPDGIRVSRWRRVDQTYPWSDVKHVAVSRLDHSRRDFHRLKIVLVGGTKPI